MPATDDELVKMYSDLISYTKKEIESAQERLAEYAHRLHQVCDRVIQNNK